MGCKFVIIHCSLHKNISDILYGCIYHLHMPAMGFKTKRLTLSWEEHVEWPLDWNKIWRAGDRRFYFVWNAGWICKIGILCREVISITFRNWLNSNCEYSLKIFVIFSIFLFCFVSQTKTIIHFMCWFITTEIVLIMIP